MNKKWPLKKGHPSSASVVQGNDSHLNWHQWWSKRLSNLYSSPLPLCSWSLSEPGPSCPPRTAAAEGTEAALGTGVTGEAGSGYGAQGRAGLCQAWVGADGAGELSWSTAPGKASQVWWWPWGTGSSSLKQTLWQKPWFSVMALWHKEHSEGICQCSVEFFYQPISLWLWILCTLSLQLRLLVASPPVSHGEPGCCHRATGR